MNTIVKSAIDIHEAHPLFAAEIRGIDISRPLDSLTIEQIHTAIDRYAVVFFRNQTLTDETQSAFARQFGDLEVYTASHRETIKLRLSRPEMVDISNLDAVTGEVQARDARHRLLTMSSRLWHADSSFRNPVGALSMLFAHAVPPKGGETEFADTRAAYDALPAVTKKELEDLIGEHSMMHGYEMLGFTDFERGEAETFRPVRHPLVRVHTRTKRKALYLGWSVMRVLGMPVPEGRILVSDLAEFATQRTFVYSHSWRAGDLVIWDNRSVMHRGRPYDESYVRDLRRITTSDTTDSILDE